MLLLAHLLSLNPDWIQARILVRSIVETESELDYMAKSLEEFMSEARIQADTEVLVRPPEQTVVEVMHSNSDSTDMVFLGLQDPKSGTESEYARWLNEVAGGFQTTIFVRNSGEFAGNLI